MKHDADLMRRSWFESTQIKFDGKRYIAPEWDSHEALMLVRETVAGIVRSKERLFRQPSRRRPERRTVVASELGKMLERCLQLDVWQVRKSFPHHRLDPYFELFADHFCASPLFWDERLRHDVDQLNDFSDQLRTAGTDAGFKKNVSNHERGAIKNAHTVIKYINALYREYPKILHVRLELFYERAWLDIHTAISASEMKMHREKLMRYVRKTFGEDAIGHIWTVEYGAFKGGHFHVFIHFNGQKVRKGIRIARQIGMHWQHTITKGRGLYWNVNNDEYRFEAEGRRGIGLISHLDEARRLNLLNSALYLVKVDLFVKVLVPGFGKTFGLGRFRPRTKSNAGRKRKQSDLQTWIEMTSVRRAVKRNRFVLIHADRSSADDHASPGVAKTTQSTPHFPSPTQRT